MPGALSGLPVDGKPGSFEWAEEVVELMNAAWRTREMAEGDFLKAARAALEYRIWEALSPPFPQEPYTSLEGLIRHTADPGQAENMQIAIRFSGILDETAPAPSASRQPASVAAAGTGSGEARVAVPGAGDREPGNEAGAPSGRPLSEEEELALGNALLEQYASQLAARTGPAGADAQAAAGRMVAAGEEVRLPAGRGMGEGAGRGRPEAAGRSATQRKRDRLERTHPDLAEAVDAGELTLKQAYVQAGIEKEVRTIDKLQRLWRMASEEERDRFLTWLEEQEGAERRREYEDEVYGDEA